MRIVKTIAGMQRQAKKWRRQGIAIGCVPTMGGLHPGHLSLVRHARRKVGRKGKVVLTIFVNPTQFAPHEDFASYPRDLARDARLCRAAGVDVIFAPSPEEIYPSKSAAPYSTWVTEEQLSMGLEGASRPTHFRGVTTVVAKLFNIVLPDVAVFGAKDFQQAAIVKKMVRDLNFPLQIVVAPTFREPDGLAMSSRNQYLKGPLRAQAVVLSQAIARARAAVRKAAIPVSAARLAADLTQFIERQPAARVDYVAFFDAETLVPVKHVKRGTHMALAVFIGKTRLIDNARL
jgi:pantoate--beta-alanine ligase